MGFQLDLTGSKGDDKLRRDRERARRSMLGTRPGGDPQYATENPMGGFGAKLRADKQLLKFFGGGLNQVLGSIGQAGTDFRNRSFGQYKSALGDINQQAIGSGRFGTSGTNQLQLGALGQMQQNFAKIDSALAGVYSNVAMQGLGTLLGIRRDIGYNEFERAQFEAGNWWPAGREYTPSGGTLMDLFATISGAATTAGNVLTLGGAISPKGPGEVGTP